MSLPPGSLLQVLRAESKADAVTLTAGSCSQPQLGCLHLLSRRCDAHMHKAGVTVMAAVATQEAPASTTDLKGMAGFQLKVLQLQLILDSASWQFLPAGESPVCVVTGGGRGIGKAIALALGAQGARVSPRSLSQSHPLEP